MVAPSLSNEAESKYLIEPNETIEIEVEDAPKAMELAVGSGAEINIGSIFGDFMPKRKKKRKLPLKEARKLIKRKETNLRLSRRRNKPNHNDKHRSNI